MIEQSGEGCALMDAWDGAEDVFIADAVQSGANPGKIFRIEAHRESIPSDFFHYSSHAFSLAEAIEMARALERLPRHVTGASHSVSVQIGANHAAYTADIVTLDAGADLLLRPVLPVSHR